MKLSYILLTVLALLCAACSPIVKMHENEHRPALTEQADAAYTPVTIENINEKGEVTTSGTGRGLEKFEDEV